jgi:hypothetical protein
MLIGLLVVIIANSRPLPQAGTPPPEAVATQTPEETLQQPPPQEEASQAASTVGAETPPPFVERATSMPLAPTPVVTLLNNRLESATASLQTFSQRWDTQRPRFADRSAALQHQLAEVHAAAEAARRPAPAPAPAPAPVPVPAPTPVAAPVVASARPAAARPERRSASGIQSVAGAPPTGWLRCTQPCGTQGSRVTLPSLVPLWRSPYSADRIGVARGGSYGIVSTDVVAEDLWVEVSLR